MTERLRCRHCITGSALRRTGSSPGPRPFAIAGSRPHYAPDTPFRLEHIRIEAAVDPKAKGLSARTTQKLRVVAPNQTVIRMDQIGLSIERASIDGEPIPFETEGHQLRLKLNRAREVGSFLEVAVEYSASNPKRGLYFTGPDANYPNKTYQTWSQGQDEDNRYWFPTFDYPNQKATSEILCTVPKGFTVIANGALVKREDREKESVFHYKLGTPHVTYLISLVVGEFVEFTEQGPGGIPVQHFVRPGLEADGKRAFGNTAKMIEAFGKRIGVPYPYEKYSQVAVQDFIFGGMENTSATTQTELTLHDERAHLDFSSDPLVSHELAHQWFGDLLTCRDWSHAWLNEGFATFMERVWIEHSPELALPEDEAKYYSYQDLKEYLEDDAHKYRRSIVCNTYIEPIDLFDTHLYQKGGLVLNLMRHLLGETLFWESIRSYVTRHRGQNVETLDLIRAIEDTTGRNMRRFFDEWVFGAGHPDFEVAYQWHDERKQAELTIEQKQTRGLPALTEGGATTHLFHLPVVIEFTLEGGKKHVETIEIGEARERVLIPVASRPLMVRFDPGYSIPKTMKFPRPKELLLHQLAHDSDCMGRIEACHELAKIADSGVIEALGKAASSDPFWGVQVEAAAALAGIRAQTAREELLQALPRAKHPKARRGIVRSLGRYKDAAVAKALRPLAERDASYFVEAEATEAWVGAQVRADMKASAPEIAELERFLLSQLEKPSYREQIRSGALKAFGELPGIAQGERPVPLSTLLEWSLPGKPMDARGAALSALGRVARNAVPAVRGRILDHFDSIADEDHFRVRMWLIAALGRTESAEAVPILEKIRTLDLDGRVRREAQMMVDALRYSGTAPQSMEQLRMQLEKLEEQQTKLRDRLFELEKR